MSENRKIPTSAEVYAVIMARHRDQLKPFASFSNPTGDSHIGSGSPEMYTDWGFPDATEPFMGARTTWERGEKEYERKNEKSEFWLYAVKMEEP